MLGAAFPFVPIQGIGAGGPIGPRLAWPNGYRYRWRNVITPAIHQMPDGGEGWVKYRLTSSTLRSVANSGHVVNDAAWPDIRFETGSGSPLEYELESWNTSTGALVVYVHLTNFVADANYTVLLNYGKVGITANEANPTGCWTGYLQSVDMSTGIDRSGNGRHFTLTNVAAATLLGSHAGDFGESGGAPPITPSGIVPIQDLTVIGRAVWGTDVGNTDIGGASNTMCAYIGVAPMSGSFNKLTAWFITSSTPGAYSDGTGGTIRCSIQTVDGSNNPTGTLIGGSVDHVLSLVSGHWVGSSMTQLQAQFPDLTLSSPAALTAGQKFAIVFQNVHASPAANYVGLDALYQYAGSAGGMGFNSPHLDPIWDHKKKDGAGAWVSRRTTSGSDQYYTVPIFVLTDTGAGNSISQTFMADLDGRIFGGTQVCRQLLTPATTVTVDRAYIMLARNVVGCTSFRLGITLGSDTTGTYLNSNAAFADTDISSLPVQLLTAPDVEPDEYAGRSVAVTFPAPITLNASTQYALLVSTPTASGIHIHACGIGSSWWAGKHFDPFGGGLAQYGTVSSYATWTNIDARLPVYLLPV